MNRYLNQLESDIAFAIANVPQTICDAERQDILAWKSEEEDLATAQRKSLEEWTGISKDQLPPHETLDG